MSARYLGGIVSKDPLTLNPAAGNAANGVFTLNQYMQAVKNATWPGFDPYFKQNVLLLHGDGTNGAQNNTFLDSSTNNFTITRNGNTTQGTFSPFSGPNGYWGNYFGGDGNYLSVPYNAAFDFSTGDFTVECFAWVIDAGRSNDSNKYGTFVSGGANLSTTNLWSTTLLITSGVISSLYIDVNGSSVLTVSGQSIPLNAWHHFVFCRTGTTLSIFVNGSRVGTTTYSSAINTNSGGTVQIARSAYGGLYANWLSGYIANARIIKGSGPYNATQTTLTVPTAPLTNITNTSLLTCQSNRFVDNSTNAFTVTAVGSPRVTPFSPFAPTAAYSAGTNGGSGYFDGTGDYLETANNADFDFGTGNFTIEAWFYIAGNAAQDANGNRQAAIFTALSASGTVTGYELYVVGNSTTTGTGVVFTSYVSGTGYALTYTATITQSAWHHVAVARSGTTTKMFYDGAEVVSTTLGNQSVNTSGNPLFTGYSRYSGFPLPFFGYISNLRVVKGTAVYTAAFTPPTAPFTAISGTEYLLNFTNAGIIDNTGKNNLETVGNAQIDTTTKKFGDGSLEFDGNGDYLLVPASPDNIIGAGDFTIEMWAYVTDYTTASPTFNDYSAFVDYRTANASQVNILLSFLGTLGGIGRPCLYVNGATRITGNVMALNTWTHIALCRSSGTTKLFMDGIQAGSSYSDTNNYVSDRFSIATNIARDAFLKGFIDDLRITKGVARYTSNFAVPYLPQGPLPLVGGPYIPNTVLMLPGTGTNGAQNNTFLDSSTNNFTITRNGNATQGTFSPFSRANGYWGNFFVNTYINTASVAGFAFGTGDYTIEGWVYPVTTKSAMRFIQFSDNNDNIDINVTNTGSLNYYNGTTSTTSAGNVLTINAWNHIAIVRSSGTVRGYANGVQVLTQATTPNTTANRIIYIGGVTNQFWEGYISNVRVVKGTAVYTSSFTPTGPLTAIANTSLLTCQSNRFIDNSTNNFTITRNGDVKVVTFSPFEYLTAYSPTTNGGSGYFDGTGDYLSTPNVAALRLGAGDFTCEAWIYPNRLTNTYVQSICGTYGYISAADRGWTLYLNSTGYLTIALYGAAGAGFVLTSGTITTINAWSHVAAVRSGSTVKLYLNGVEVASGTSSKDEDYTVADFYIGTSRTDNLSPSVGNAGVSFQGNISSLRVVKGTAVYTSAFTPPTAPLTAIANTSILTNFTNAGIYDASMSNDFETVGNAQVSTTQSKWGGGSMYFDGSGDYLVSPHVADFEFGSGNFTIEFWAYANAISGAYTGVVGVWQGGASATANSWLVLLNCFNATNKFGFSYSNGSAAVDYVFDATTTTGSWNHYMVVRSGNTLYGFKNGVLLGFSSGTSAISGSITNGTQPLYIGTGGTASSGTDFNGYISDLRILKGVAILPTPLQTSQWQDQ